MPKKLFSIFFICFLIITSVFVPISASAYEVTSFEITAEAGMLISLDTGEVLWEKNPDKKMYPASITKIMTAILMVESDLWNPEAKVTLTKAALDKTLGTGLAVSLLKEGEEFTQLDLLYMVLLSSFGDCAYLAADVYGGSLEGFVEMMNDKAKELGLNGTHYSNPVGLHEEETYTTARDTYNLCVYAKKHDIITEICGKSRYKLVTTKGTTRTLSTTNFLLDQTTNYYYQYASGFKTGYTGAAGRCLVSTASHNGYNYMCILLKCPNRPNIKRYEFVESRELYRWAFNNFSFREIAKSNEPVCEIPVEMSLETDFLPLYFEKPFISVLPNEADDSTIIIKTYFENETAVAPIKKGDVLGYAEVVYAEKVIGTVDLIAGQDVKVSGLLQFWELVKDIFTSKYMKAVYIIIAAVIVGFILVMIKLNWPRKRRRVKYIPYKERDLNNDKD
ncbi:MAG: D-alanyl-D-alanine carboxypeptidase [Clostridia bacterium]|nr:D-alanyl-D-alanine carboxypeptidase [Clostridia bacterium]